MRLIQRLTRRWPGEAFGNWVSANGMEPCLSQSVSFSGKEPFYVRTHPAPFTLRKEFLCDNELELLRRLTHAVGDKAMICPKVRLTDILAIIDATEHMDDVIAIDRKSVDFLLCETGSMLPCVAINLADDAAAGFRAALGPVEQAFRAARLPLVRVAHSDCSVAALRESINPLLVNRFEVSPQPRQDHLDG